MPRNNQNQTLKSLEKEIRELKERINQLDALEGLDLLNYNMYCKIVEIFEILQAKLNRSRIPKSHSRFYLREDQTVDLTFSILRLKKEYLILCNDCDNEDLLKKFENGIPNFDFALKELKYHALCIECKRFKQAM